MQNTRLMGGEQLTEALVRISSAVLMETNNGVARSRT